MKRRRAKSILTLALCASMIATTCPVTAFAVDNTQVVEENGAGSDISEDIIDDAAGDVNSETDINNAAGTNTDAANPDVDSQEDGLGDVIEDEQTLTWEDTVEEDDPAAVLEEEQVLIEDETVEEEAASSIAVSLSQTEAQVAAGATLQLIATVTKDDSAVEGASLSWSSDNETVATVDSNGLVTGVMAGTANITVSYTENDTEYTAICAVTVEDAYVVTLDKTEIECSLSTDTMLTATVTKDDTAVEDAVVTWSSADEKVATVSEAGVVTSVSFGETKVTATYTVNNVDYTADCTVRVVASHTVFSHSTFTLAPGVSYYNNYAYSSDGKQMVYYVATANINREDVLVQSSYKDAQCTEYGMAKLTEQMASANAKYSDPENSEYISQYYTAVAGTNGDFYNMTTGQPSGAFVMNGVMSSSRANNRPWFAIFKDGTALCGYNNADWDAAVSSHGDVRQAVGGSQVLVKDGKDVTASATGSYNTDRHSRTMVGVTADNQVVMAVLDGRQEPFSCGGTMHELAQIMIEAGCITAINLDGGGSTTFAARPEGSDSVQIMNRPSDGSERSISSGLIIASTAASSSTFDHAILKAESEYVTPRSEVRITATGVSQTGTAAEIPEGVTFTATNGTYADGVFTSDGTAGDAVITMSYDGKEAGSVTIHVVVPDSISFTSSTITVPYGKTAALELEAKYGLNDVTTKASDFSFTLDDEKAGTIDGLNFTACSEDVGITEGTITAVFTGHEDIKATANLSFGKGSVEIYNYEDDNSSTDDYETKFWRGTPSDYNYLSPRGTVELVDSTTGRVHSGNQAYRVTVDYSNSWESGYQCGVIAMSQELDIKGASRLGMWIWIPKETQALSMNYICPPVTGTDDAGNKTVGSALRGGMIDGVTTSTGFTTQYADAGWHYFYIDLDPTKEYYWGKDYTFVQFYISDRDGSSFNYNHTDYSSSNTKMVFYIDDLTIDYSSVVDDREAPVFSSVLYADETMSDAATFADGMTVTSSKLSFTAKVDDNKTKDNYSGIDKSGLKVLVDGNEISSKYENGMLSVQDVELKDGVHIVKFIASDKMGNTAALKRSLMVNAGNSGTVRVVPHDSSLDKILLGSLYYIDIVADNAENLSLVELKLDLNNVSVWNLDHADVLDGYEMAYDVDNDDNVATIRLKKTGTVKTNGKSSVLASIPIRTWELPAVEAIYGHEGAVWTYADYKKGNEVWPEEIRVTVDQGRAVYEDGTEELFSGDTIHVSTESYLYGNQTKDEHYASWDGGHIHTIEAMDDVAATCTKDGYKNRTFCKVCNSVVDWGETIPATGHTYELTDGVLKCKDCGTTFTGEYSDGKYYQDGIAAVGWVDDSYYQDGVKLTGIQEVDDYYYDFGQDGVCKNKTKYSGLFTRDDSVYYAVLGKLRSGWIDIDTDYYYFNPSGYAAVDGVQSIADVTYTFKNYKLVKGEWITDATGIKYMWAGRGHTAGWDTIDGKVYLFNGGGYVKQGYYPTKSFDGSGEKEFLFDANGAWIGPDYTGLFVYGENTYYALNGYATDAGLVKVGNDYYYIKGDRKAAKNCSYFISHTNNLLPAGIYQFDYDGRMSVPDPDAANKKNGIVEEDGVKYYYIDGVKTYAGLIIIDGSYYYVNSSYKVICGQSYFISKTNGLLDMGSYKFDEDGKMEGKTPELTNPKNGLIEENGDKYYYVNGARVYAGLIKIDGAYYYINSSLKAVRGKSYMISKTNNLLPFGVYDFDTDGKLYLAGTGDGTAKEGLVKEDGNIYYYVNGLRSYAGLIYVDHSYYYVNSSYKAVTNTTYFISKTNGLLPAGSYKFDADGKMIVDQQ